MLKYQVYEIVDATELLEKLSKTEMEFKLAYRFKRVIKALHTAVEPFNKKRMELFKELGLEDPETKMLQIPEHNKAIFGDRIKVELFKTLEIDCELIPFKLIENSSLKLTPIEINALEKFLEGVPSV